MDKINKITVKMSLQDFVSNEFIENCYNNISESLMQRLRELEAYDYAESLINLYKRPYDKEKVLIDGRTKRLISDHVFYLTNKDILPLIQGVSNYVLEDIIATIELDMDEIRENYLNSTISVEVEVGDNDDGSILMKLNKEVK